MPAEVSQSRERQKRRQSFPEKGVTRGEAAGKNKVSNECIDTGQADIHTFSNGQWSIVTEYVLFLYCLFILYIIITFHPLNSTRKQSTGSYIHF